jgi:hypothetical protein
MKKFALALVLLLSATSMTLAQSQRNYGPNGPAKSDCFGAPYSGTIASRCRGGHR